jgi:plasmid stabilization system protein ParE
MLVTFRPEAAHELREAQLWYESKAVGLGLEFVRAFEAAIESAKRNPTGHPAIEADFRRVLLRRFPYALIYLPSELDILVIAVFNTRRAPNIWLNRSTD